MDLHEIWDPTLPSVYEAEVMGSARSGKWSGEVTRTQPNLPPPPPPPPDPPTRRGKGRGTTIG